MCGLKNKDYVHYPIAGHYVLRRCSGTPPIATQHHCTKLNILFTVKRIPVIQYGLECSSWRELHLMCVVSRQNALCTGAATFAFRFSEIKMEWSTRIQYVCSVFLYIVGGIYVQRFVVYGAS